MLMFVVSCVAILGIVASEGDIDKYLGSDKASSAERKKLFIASDVNRNKKLALFEITFGISKELKSYEDFGEAIKRAFHDSKNYAEGSADDYIEPKEIKQFLILLDKYQKYEVLFNEVDENKDGRLALIEFKNKQDRLERYAGKIDAEEEFKIIDVNHGGYILIEEFFSWADNKNLHENF